MGLTGGLGAGKSTALAALGRLGAATLSTDAVVHELYDGAAVREAVRARFGAEMAPSDGAPIDRAALAARVFADPADRQWLEGLLWPLVGARVAAWIEGQRRAQPPPRAIVVEVPLLFESGMEAVYDATIAIVADEGLRHERARARGHAALDERAARQLGQEEKAARATYVVRNDGDVAELEKELSRVFDTLTSS